MKGLYIVGDGSGISGAIAAEENWISCYFNWKN